MLGRRVSFVSECAAARVPTKVLTRYSSGPSGVTKSVLSVCLSMQSVQVPTWILTRYFSAPLKRRDQFLIGWQLTLADFNSRLQ